MQDGRPGYGPIPLMPAPMAAALESIATDRGPTIAFTLYFANGQVTGLFEPDSLKELAEDMLDKVREVTTGLQVPKTAQGNGLIIP